MDKNPKFKKRGKTYSQADRFDPKTGKKLNISAAGRGAVKGTQKVTDANAYKNYLMSTGSSEADATERSRKDVETGLLDKSYTRTGPLYKLTGGRVGRTVTKTVKPGEVSVTKNKTGKTKVLGDKVIETTKTTKLGKKFAIERNIKRAGQTSKKALAKEAASGMNTPGLSNKVTTGSNTQTTFEGNRFGRGKRISGGTTIGRKAGYSAPQQSTFAAERKAKRSENKQKRSRQERYVSKGKM